MTCLPFWFGPARCGAGRGEGRTPGWRAKLAPPAGSRTAGPPLLLLGSLLTSLVTLAPASVNWCRGRRAAGPAVARRPSGPGVVEVLFGLVELLDAQLADLLLDPVQACCCRADPGCRLLWWWWPISPPLGLWPARWRADPQPPARPPGCHHQRRVGPTTGNRPLPRRAELRRPRIDSLKSVKRALAQHVHTGAVAQIGERLDQSLRVLVRARARSIRRLELSFVHLRGSARWLVTSRPQPEMDHLRSQSRVSYERRVKLQRQVRTRDNAVDRQNMGARPSTRRLTNDRFIVDRELEVDRRPRTHASQGIASTRQQVNSTAPRDLGGRWRSHNRGAVASRAANDAAAGVPKWSYRDGGTARSSHFGGERHSATARGRTQRST